MKVKCYKEAAAAYIQLSSKHPDGGVEIEEGLIVHATSHNEIVAIEIIAPARSSGLKTSINWS